MSANQFGQRLKEALETQGLTQGELADRLGVSRPLIGHWATGRRDPDTAMLARIARELRVDLAWLSGEQKDRTKAGSAAWSFPQPISGQRDYGNANIWTVPADIATLVREAIQNSRDASDEGATSVAIRFRLIELRGESVHAFWKAAGWDDLFPHLQAASRMKGKLARKLAAGLRRKERQRDRLMLLRIDDFGTKGLLGDEVGKGSFAALVRNNLDSEKQSTGAGGSFGLGKAAHWRCSDISTVLFNTVTKEHTARVIARAELTYHELNGREHAGPGWFGMRGTAAHVESLNDQKLAEQLHLVRDPLPEELQFRITSPNGTTILIVAFQDPASEQIDDAAEIVSEIEREAAVNFWPAILTEKISVVVEHIAEGQKRSQKIVDPRSYLPEHCEMLEKALADEAVETFQHEGDVAIARVPLRLPKCIASGPEVIKHGALETTATLLVRLVEPDDTARTSGKSHGSSDNERGRLRREYLNTVAMTRGPLMVTQYVKKDGILVGARPFYAVLLAGAALDESEASTYVEQFLRAAEPPAHDKWAYTDDLREMYERGAKTRLNEFLLQGLSAALRRVLRTPARDVSDGPDEFRKLLHLGGGPGEVKRESAAVLRNLSAEFTDGKWSVRADVVVKRPNLQITPNLALNAESGRAQALEWEKLQLVESEGVQKRGNTFHVSDAQRFTFRGVANCSDAIVEPRRASVRLSIAVERVSAKEREVNA